MILINQKLFTNSQELLVYHAHFEKISKIAKKKLSVTKQKTCEFCDSLTKFLVSFVKLRDKSSGGIFFRFHFDHLNIQDV